MMIIFALLLVLTLIALRATSNRGNKTEPKTPKIHFYNGIERRARTRYEPLFSIE